MLTQAVLMVAALCAQAVCSSVYHGPTAHPVVLHNGFLADTHEVAAAKSAHLSTLSQQSHSNHGDSHGYHGDSHGYHGDSHSNHGDNHAYHGDSHGYHGDSHVTSRYHGPTALPHVLHDGHIADTHDVAAAKAEHYAAVAKARAHGYHGDRHGYHGNSQGDSTYHGHTALPHVLHDGHIADTHDVAAAKAEHYAAVAKARAHAHGGFHHGGDESSHYASGYHHYSGASAAHHGYGTHGSYHGPLAQPVVLPSGYLADTHDVAHAKEHHLQLLNTPSHH